MPGLDLGLWMAAQHLKKLKTRPDAKGLLKIAEQWRPWRSAAALLLWHYRRNMPDWSKKELPTTAKPKIGAKPKAKKRAVRKKKMAKKISGKRK
jgi:DNA-3-methyladenine glycosylase II